MAKKALLGELLGMPSATAPKQAMGKHPKPSDFISSGKKENQIYAALSSQPLEEHVDQVRTSRAELDDAEMLRALVDNTIKGSQGLDQPGRKKRHKNV